MERGYGTAARVRRRANKDRNLWNMDGLLWTGGRGCQQARFLLVTRHALGALADGFRTRQWCR